MSKAFPVVQTLPVAQGTPEYHRLVDSIVKEQFADKVPPEYRLPADLIANPPKNVTNVPRECGILTPAEIAITENHDATALAEAIRAQKLTAVEVATAFAKRAIIAHQLTCCLVEWFMDEAVADAKKLDEHLARTGQTVGPLHGVPVSIKEHMQMAGHWSADGYLASRTRDREDCHAVGILRAQGAVFYCKTNQPQGIMHLETVSPYGRTLNPHNIHLSAGGSSGGEGALIALRGSVLGLGTDIGGSIRGPAGFCGIYGFKPTSRVVPMNGMVHGRGNPAELTILAAAGPMAVSLRDLDLLMASVLAAKPHLRDPALVPTVWQGLRGLPTGRPLKVGLVVHNGNIAPQPPVVRAIDCAAKKLSASTTFQVQRFEPFRTADAIKNIRKAYWPDGAAGLKAGLAKTGEPVEKLTQWAIQDAEGPPYTWEQLFELRAERDEFRTRFAQHWAEQGDVDVVVGPVFVGPAAAHDTALYWDYTAFWNYVDYPGVVVPTPIRAGKKADEEPHNNTSPALGTKEDAHVRQLWDEGDFEGAPVCLQIVARRHHDNELFAAVGALKEVLELA